MWLRGNRVDETPRKLLSRKVFSICRKFLSLLQVCGWIRIVCSFVKRKVVSLTGGSNDEVYDVGVRCALEEVLKMVGESEPARGECKVPGDEGKVWVDARSLALGALVQFGEVTVEGTIWLRRDISEVHINMAELDPV